MADEARNREIVEAGYDNVADRYAELEAPGHEWPRMRWLAKLLAQIEPEAEPGSVRDWLGRPMFFSQHDAETTLELIRAAGFEVVEQAVEPQLEGERPVFFLWVLARKARLTSTP